MLKGHFLTASAANRVSKSVRSGPNIAWPPCPRADSQPQTALQTQTSELRSSSIQHGTDTNRERMPKEPAPVRFVDRLKQIRYSRMRTEKSMLRAAFDAATPDIVQAVDCTWPGEQGYHWLYRTVRQSHGLSGRIRLFGHAGATWGFSEEAAIGLRRGAHRLSGIKRLSGRIHRLSGMSTGPRTGAHGLRDQNTGERDQNERHERMSNLDQNHHGTKTGPKHGTKSCGGPKRVPKKSGQSGTRSSMEQKRVQNGGERDQNGTKTRVRGTKNGCQKSAVRMPSEPAWDQNGTETVASGTKTGPKHRCAGPKRDQKNVGTKTGPKPGCAGSKRVPNKRGQSATRASM